jgi:hypothetical protein
MAVENRLKPVKNSEQIETRLNSEKRWLRALIGVRCPLKARAVMVVEMGLLQN